MAAVQFIAIVDELEVDFGWASLFDGPIKRIRLSGVPFRLHCCGGGLHFALDRA